jgi:hypothetical protein
VAESSLTRGADDIRGGMVGAVRDAREEAEALASGGCRIAADSSHMGRTWS